MSETQFPWLMSNVVDIETSKPLAGAEVFHLVERCGKKVHLKIKSNIIQKILLTQMCVQI